MERVQRGHRVWLGALALVGAVALSCSAAEAIVVFLAKQDPERTNRTVVESETTLARTPGALALRVDELGHRITDAEPHSGGANFDALSIVNFGKPGNGYASEFGREAQWVHGKTLNQLAQLADDGWRIIDLEPYIPSGGSAYRYAAALVRNTGIAKKSWWFYGDQTLAQINANAAANEARVIDLEREPPGRYAAVMIRNSGVDQTASAILTNVSPGEVLSHPFRPLDIEYRGGSAWDAVLVDDGVAVQWKRGLSAGQVLGASNASAQRVIDLERQAGAYSLLLVNGATPPPGSLAALTSSRVAASAPKADYGFWAGRGDGSGLLGHQADLIHEPASAIKVLALIFALREVEAGRASLDGTNVTWEPYPQCADGKQTSLRDALDAMMKVSDNAATHGVISSLGRGKINSFAAQRWPGMRIRGCGLESGRSDWSLRQAADLYSKAADGTLLTTAAGRRNFRDLMITFHPGGDVVAEEAARAGLTESQRATFTQYAFRQKKGGGLGVCRPSPAPCSPPYLAVATDMGILELPFLEGEGRRVRGDRSCKNKGSGKRRRKICSRTQCTAKLPDGPYVDGFSCSERTCATGRGVKSSGRKCRTRRCKGGRCPDRRKVKRRARTAVRYSARPEIYTTGFFIENARIPCSFQGPSESTADFHGRCPAARAFNDAVATLADETTRLPIREAMEDWAALPPGAPVSPP